MYEKIKKYYESGVWELRKVHDAVVKGWITAAEFKTITGKEYTVA